MDELRSFQEEERGKMGKEKVPLHQDPPYMEIRTRTDNALNTETKENCPQSKLSLAQKVEMNYGLSLPLGDDYEKKKQKLQQELRMDYRRYMAQEKDLNGDVSDLFAKGLSLPIGERKSAKDRLRNERNKEYNQFLIGQGGHGRLIKEATKALQQVQNRDAERPAVPRALPDLPDPPSGPSAPAPRERLPSRRDAATLTEERVGPRSRVQVRRARRRLEEGPEPLGRRPTRFRVDYDSQQDYSEEEMDFVDRRKPRPSQQPEYSERRGHRLHHRPEGEITRLREWAVDDSDDYPEMGHYVQRRRNDRRVRERRKAEPPLVREDDYREGNRRTVSASPKPRLQALEPTPASERARSVGTKDRAEFATGLMIGAADEGLAAQTRKERYRLELLEQMAEQQRNKRREKELELRVAATGAVDPEKKPDRIKPFGAVNRDYDGKRRDVPYLPGRGLDALGADLGRERRPPADTNTRVPPDRPRAAFQAPHLDHSALGALVGTGTGAVPPLNEDFHRGLSSTLGELVTPRVAVVPPPPPPTLADAYRTPYDQAYYYYGARNPLDPNLAHYGLPAGGEQPTAFLGQPPGAPQHSRSGHPPQVTAALGAFPTERPKQDKESVLNYQEALKQQMQERQEKKRREKEDKDRYDAKLEAEMRAYNPWGKGGGGAPLRDSQGDLLTDLNRMHKVNEQAYLNPDSRGKRAAGSVCRNIPSPGGEERAPSAHRVSGFSYAQAPGFARGNPFTDLPTPQQLYEQDKYRDYLKQQIEEKRRKEAQERERLRLEEEKEEKKLADQRALIQREFEEEQARKRTKEREQDAQNEEQVRLLKERRREEEQRKRENNTLRQQGERPAQLQEKTPREPSPPVPVRSTPALSERSVSVPPSPPVPARRNQLRAAEEQPGVISELSTLRRQLRSEQRRLDRELRQTEREGLDSPLSARHRERPLVDVFDMARLRLQAPVRRNSAKAADPVNLQNIRDFNQLKYRDSESREEVRQTYPDPPVDDWSLELQQQALLREQQRKINRAKRRDSAGYFELSPALHQTHDVRKGPADGPPRGYLLESESAFIGTSADAFPVPAESEARPEQRARPPSARRSVAKRLSYEDERPPSEVSLEPAGPLHSAGSFSVEQLHNRNQRRIERLEEMSSRAWTAGEVGSEDGDSILRLASPQDEERRCSVETFATEPWLRPGTSDTLKRFIAGQTRRERLTSRESLARNWEGPSTYHG
ncbi:hypothetical protein AAFF_G00093750 [Aldrovandia affinis]|uniref:Centrosome and spindle pole-associated protein 1 C-terminal domain-containing protein n=1 Tax=Aldrovandia affinis TaxID=143900 RepID=A0AAD7T2U2_9TELE|nr:hypothetical protein AAFF_G00093750 [Aldrovandia affinis]